jgi:hypothetical protein
MKRRELILIALCAPLTGVGCASAGRTTGVYHFQKNNMEEASVWAWIQLDKRRWDGFNLVGKQGRSYGGLKLSSDNPMPWPKRLVVRWKLKDIEGIREQEMDLPPHPLMPDGTLSTNPYLYLVFFEDRVLVFSCYRWLYRDIEDKAKIEYEAARAAGVPGARIVETSEGYKKLREDSWEGFISTW